MLDYKNLNEHVGFMLKLMNVSMYPSEDFYTYLTIFKQRDKECSIYYDLAKNMDRLKSEFDIVYKPIFKEFPDEFEKINKEHFTYKHFELTHSTYLKIYLSIKEHLENTDSINDQITDVIEWLDYFKDTVTVEGMFNFLRSGNYNYKITQDILLEKEGIPF